VGLCYITPVFFLLSKLFLFVILPRTFAVVDQRPSEGWMLRGGDLGGVVSGVGGAVAGSVCCQGAAPVRAHGQMKGEVWWGGLGDKEGRSGGGDAFARSQEGAGTSRGGKGGRLTETRQRKGDERPERGGQYGLLVFCVFVFCEGGMDKEARPQPREAHHTPPVVACRLWGGKPIPEETSGLSIGENNPKRRKTTKKRGPRGNAEVRVGVITAWRLPAEPLMIGGVFLFGLFEPTSKRTRSETGRKENGSGLVWLQGHGGFWGGFYRVRRMMREGGEG